MGYNNNNSGMHIVMRSAYGGYGYVPYVSYGEPKRKDRNHMQSVEQNDERVIL